ncbi:hypothetical protein DFH29DRAFT_415069 [Suillus ampliporus]|nr:hypothetical protein DFH29DRAFT_415069 [Suillus ampliporus]
MSGYATLAGEIVACCPELRYLAGDRSPLYFASDTSLPEYPYLKKLKVYRQEIYYIAPLLRRLCSLESFELLQSDVYDGPLDRVLPPTFRLSTLSMSYTKLSSGQCKWLFASSFQTIESLEVEEVGESLGYLSEVIGGCLKNVHLKSSVDGTIKALYMFAGLRRLRISESNFDTEALLRLPSSLETVAIIFSEQSMSSVLRLLHSNWQPSLHSLDVYYSPSQPVSWQLIVASNQCHANDLQRACAARGIQLNWMKFS